MAECKELPKKRDRVWLRSFAELGEPRRRTAIQEAGHAVVAHVVGSTVDEVTILYHSLARCRGGKRRKAPPGNGGFCRYKPSSETRDRFANHVATIYAGTV